MSEKRPRWIIHLDLDAFFASVEELLDPTIAGLPVIVGGSPDGRGVVSSASYPARAYGVHSAMPMAQALRLCPQAVVRSSRHGVYSSYSHKVMAILSQYTPLLEQVSIDEAFLDVTGCERLFGPPKQMAQNLQSCILTQVGLPSSLGVASNKLVAKVASDLAKPRGVVVVERGQEAAFLAPLAIECLWGIGDVTARRLHQAGVDVIGQLASLPDARMRMLFGSTADDMRRRALGIDNRPVGPSGPHKSISEEHTFAQDTADVQAVHRKLLQMSEDVAAQLRRHHEVARTVVLKMRYPDFHTITRQVTLSRPTDLANIVYVHVTALLDHEWQPTTRVRLIGVGVAGLERGYQLELLDATGARLGKLSEAVDSIRGKYGRDAIRRASLLHDDDE